jgi:hypothetical protein
VAGTYSDNEITALVQERKPLPADWRTRAQLRPKRGHEERDLELTGGGGNEFRVILRKNMVNPLDFSIILAVRVLGSNTIFRLRRYNGKSHEHTNHLEGVTFYDFHIHIATERYQEIGTREDAYAEPTDRYGDFNGALLCLLNDANFDVPPEVQVSLFEEVGR